MKITCVGIICSDVQTLFILGAHKANINREIHRAEEQVISHCRLSSQHHHRHRPSTTATARQGSFEEIVSGNHAVKIVMIVGRPL